MKILSKAAGPSMHAIALALVDGNEIAFSSRRMTCRTHIFSIVANDERLTYVIKGKLLAEGTDTWVPFTATYRRDRYDIEIEEEDSTTLERNAL